MRRGGFHFQVRPAKDFSGLLGNGSRALGTRYDHLTLGERKLIFQLREAKMSVPRIAERLCRHRSTIHREIRRNWHDDGPWLRGYFPQAAQSRTDRRRIRQRKLHLNPDLARHVIAQLQQAWSPEQIAGRLRRESGGEQRISQDTFSERPDEIAERSSFGHWEGDLVMFRRAHGQRSVLSLVERQTRFAVLRVQPSRHSKPIMNSLTEDLGGLPPAARRTVTFDRGTEFAAYPALKTSLGMDAYFCAPQAPWQKGTVENTNGRLRRFLPLDADISDRSTADLRALAAKMNATPRKCLGFMTPAEAFAASLRSCGVSSAGPGP
jgi:IS30 family transposase